MPSIVGVKRDKSERRSDSRTHQHPHIHTSTQCRILPRFGLIGSLYPCLFLFSLRCQVHTKIDASESSLTSRVNGIEAIVISLRKLISHHMPRTTEPTNPSINSSPDPSINPSPNRSINSFTDSSTKTPIWAQILHALDEVALEVQSIRSELRSKPNPEPRGTLMEYVQSRSLRPSTPEDVERCISLADRPEHDHKMDDDESMSLLSMPEDGDENSMSLVRIPDKEDHNSKSLSSLQKNTPEGSSSATGDHE